MADNWNDGSDYEQYVGRWSRRAAPKFLDWLGRDGGAWVDLGCGTGALTQAILDRCSPERVTGVEPSEAFLKAAEARNSDPRAAFVQGAGGALPVPDASVDTVASALVLNFIPDLPAALADARRALRKGGVLGGYVWDYAGHAQFIRYFWDAAQAIDPEGAAKADEGPRFPLCRPDPLRAAFADAGFSGVTVAPIDIATPFRDFEEYWAPFTTGIGPAPGYCMGLPDDRRKALKANLAARVPTDGDGMVLMAARVWAVKGVSG